jgi:myosin heavy subunit
MAKQIKATDIFESEDIFRGIRQSAEQAIDTLGKFKTELKQTADELKKTIGGATVGDTKSINELIAATQKANQVKEQTVKIDQEQEKLRKLSIQSEREEIKLKKDQQAALDREAKAREKVARETAKQNSAYSQESAKLNELRKRYKDLAVQNKENTAEARKLLNEIGALDTKLKQIDATVGQHQRNVGNYADSMKGLQSTLSTFGVAFGIGEIAGGIFNINKELDTATNTARMFFNETQAASQKLAESAIVIGKSWGKETNEVLAAANVLTKEFGISGEEALNRINVGFTKGGDVQGELIQNIKEYSSQLSYAGLNADETIAIITQSQQQGVFSDKGVDAIKEAALSLREMTQPAQDALAAIGMSGIELQQQIENGELTYFEAIQKISAKTAEFGQGSREAGMILADVFKGAGEDAGRFIFSLDELNLNLDQMDDQSKGLSGAIGNLTQKFYEFIFGLNDSAGVTGKLATVINFLANNLGTIVGVIGKLVVAWGAYKTIQLSLQAIEKARAFSFAEFGRNLAAQIPLTKQYAAAQKQAAAASTEAGDSAKAAGGAMSAVPWMAIIAVLIEVAMAFYDIASGAKAAREQQQMTDAALARSEKTLGKITESNRKWYDEKIRLLDLEMRKRKAAGEDEQKLEKERVQREKEIASDAAKRLNYQENIRKKELSQILQQRDVVSKIQKDFAKYGSYTTVTPQQQKVLDSVTKQMGVQYATYQDQIKFLSSQATQITDEIVGLSDAQKAYNNIVDEQNVALTENNIKQEDNTNKINAKIPKIKEEEKYIRKKTEALERENEVRESLFDPEATAKAMLLDEERAVGIADMAVLEAEIALKRLEGTKDTKALAKAEEDLRKAREAQILAQLKLDLAQTDDVNEQDRLRKEAELQILNLGKKEVEIVKMTAEQRNEWVKFATDYFIQKSNERIAQLDKEIAAAEKQQDTLRELAANGNINARESLAENQRIIDEANRKKEQQERRKQMIELVSGVYQTYNQKVAANAENPLMETIRDTVLLQQFANTLLGNMPTFFDGTENTGKHGEGVDGKGGFHAILHPNERVVPKSLNEKIGSLSNEQLAKVAQEYQNGKLITGTQPMSAIDLSLLVNKMDELTHTIRNKPETNIELGEITSSVMEIVKTTKQGNTLKTNRFKIRK